MKRCVLLLLLTLPLFACGSYKAVVTPHDPASLWNLQQARDYVAQERYELAREHYLKSLAAGNTPELRRIIAHELQSVDTIIQTQR